MRESNQIEYIVQIFRICSEKNDWYELWLVIIYYNSSFAAIFYDFIAWIDYLVAILNACTALEACHGIAESIMPVLIQRYRTIKLTHASKRANLNRQLFYNIQQILVKYYKIIACLS